MIDAVVQHAMNKFVLYLFLYWKTDEPLRWKKWFMCERTTDFGHPRLEKVTFPVSFLWEKSPENHAEGFYDPIFWLSETESAITYLYVWI